MRLSLFILKQELFWSWLCAYVCPTHRTTRPLIWLCFSSSSCSSVPSFLGGLDVWTKRSTAWFGSSGKETQGFWRKGERQTEQKDSLSPHVKIRKCAPSTTKGDKTGIFNLFRSVFHFLGKRRSNPFCVRILYSSRAGTTKQTWLSLQWAQSMSNNTLEEVSSRREENYFLPQRGKEVG